MNNRTKAIIDAIDSSFLKKRINEINDSLYNRKQECQIRDAILFYINQSTSYIGLSEFPKNGKGAVDLTLFERKQTVATIEFKFQYPGDLAKPKIIESFIKDIYRKVVETTSHFVLIVQEREKIGDLLCDLKYMNLNKPFHNDLLTDFQSNKSFPKSCQRYIRHVRATGKVDSKYTFVVYETTQLGNYGIPTSQIALIA